MEIFFYDDEALKGSALLEFGSGRGIFHKKNGNYDDKILNIDVIVK